MPVAPIYAIRSHILQKPTYRIFFAYNGIFKIAYYAYAKIYIYAAYFATFTGVPLFDALVRRFS